MAFINSSFSFVHKIFIFTEQLTVNSYKLLFELKPLVSLWLLTLLCSAGVLDFISTALISSYIIHQD